LNFDASLGHRATAVSAKRPVIGANASAAVPAVVLQIKSLRDIFDGFMINYYYC
jgi:hypothetical protein